MTELPLARRIDFVGNPTGDPRLHERGFWATDGIHPSDAGYRVWAEHIANGILGDMRQDAVQLEAE